jgi:hypothetical protein
MPSALRDFLHVRCPLPWQLSHPIPRPECPLSFQSAADAAKAKLPPAETCGQCHADRLEQFKKGKHARAWAAMKAMATIHYLDMPDLPHASFTALGVTFA